MKSAEKGSCQLISENERTLAYSFGENTYICQDCDYFLKIGKIMSEQGVEIDNYFAGKQRNN